MAHVDTTTPLPTYDLRLIQTAGPLGGPNVRGITPFVGQSMDRLVGRYVRMSGPLVSEGNGRVAMPCLSRGKPAEKYWECLSRKEEEESEASCLGRMEH